MSYPPPPGLIKSQPAQSTQQSHPSLPARPPAPAVGNGTAVRNSQSFTASTAFKPRAIAGNNSSWQGHNPTISNGPTPPSHYAGAPSYATPYQQAPPQQYQQYGYQQPSQNDAYAQQAPPQIQNPFAPTPQGGYGQNAGGANQGYGSYDPDEEAQIAQWQSAYAGKDEASNTRGGFNGTRNATNANLTALGVNTSQTPISSHEVASAAAADPAIASVITGNGNHHTVVRSGGGKSWQDPSLLEWDPAHFRIFVGNLAGEVTDESLMKAFSKWDSIQKARVVRDKRTTKSKGFGFVSFSDGDQFFQAAKEMNGKYIGSHPVIIKRSNTDIKPVNPKDRRKAKAGAAVISGGHANTGAGVQKKQNKQKGALKVLG